MNTKQKTARYAAAFFFVAALVCVSQSWLGLALVLTTMGLISSIAIWTLGLSVRSSATDEEWMNAIR